MATHRVEAITDAVIAVAVVILAFGIPRPHGNTAGDLSHAFVVDWPSFACYLVSLATIGGLWIDQHALMAGFQRVDRTVLRWTLYLLAWIALVPFTTGVLADSLIGRHLLGSGPGRTAGLVSCSVFALLWAGHVGLWHRLLKHPELRAADLQRAEVAIAQRRAAVGPILYLVAAGLSAVSPIVGVVVSAGVALWYTFSPDTADLLARQELRQRTAAAAAAADARWENNR